MGAFSTGERLNHQEIFTMSRIDIAIWIELLDIELRGGLARR
jgi:hypothetical protein